LTQIVLREEEDKSCLKIWNIFFFEEEKRDRDNMLNFCVTAVSSQRNFHQFEYKKFFRPDIDYYIQQT
jgi:hypothetical protein